MLSPRRIGNMAFSFLYPAMRALSGTLVRCRRCLHVKDLELLALRHEPEILRRQVVRPKLSAADRTLFRPVSRASSTPLSSPLRPLAADVVIIGAGSVGSLLQLVTALKRPRTLTVTDPRADALANGPTHVLNG
jgi:hypothetical protein